MDSKKTYVLSAAGTAEDKQMVIEECMSHRPIAPKPSQLLLLLIRDGLARLKRGEVTLQTLYDLYERSPLEALANRADIADLAAKASTNGNGTGAKR